MEILKRFKWKFDWQCGTRALNREAWLECRFLEPRRTVSKPPVSLGAKSGEPVVGI
jgi:hypothetical protein